MKHIVFNLITIIISLWSFGQFDSAGIIQQHTALRNNIATYTNQPFSVLYNALTIKPVVLTGFTPYNNRNVENASQFHYGNPTNPSSKNIYIDIEWETPIPTSETLQYQNKIRRNFDAHEYSIYANKIIRKVQFFPDPMVEASGVLMKKKPVVKPAKKK